MKKIISLTICLLVLFSLCVPSVAYGDDYVIDLAKDWYYEAENYVNQGSYFSAGIQYRNSAQLFSGYREYLGVAADIASYAAKAYKLDRAPHDEEEMKEKENKWRAEAEKYGNQKSFADVFGNTPSVINNVSLSGFALSEGNIAIIVGIASAVVFGAAGLIAGKAIEKKKSLATKGKETN